MDLEKLRFDDPRLHSFSTRASSVAKQHRPFVFFLIFAAFVFLCRHLPWGQSFPTYTTFDDSYNKTLAPGNGAIVFIPENNSTKAPKFAKIAVASGFEDILYEKALDTHIRHAARHGYPMYMARENAADGMFNKIAYIIDILLNELFKPAEDRVDWLLYVYSSALVWRLSANRRTLPATSTPTPSS